MGPQSTGQPLDRASDTNTASADILSVDDLAKIESAKIVAAIAIGDVGAMQEYLELTAEPIPLGLWRKLTRWAASGGAPVPWTFAAAAMIEAALSDEPLPEEPADLRAALLALDPQDLASWQQVLFPTGIYRSRIVCFLAARLAERHLGTTWATGLRSFDATHWPVATLDPVTAFDDDGVALRTLPCWITRLAETVEQRWQTPVFANQKQGTVPYTYTATQSELAVLALSNTVIFGRIGVPILGNHRPHWHGLQYLGYDYNGMALIDIITLTLRKLDSVFTVLSANILLICDSFYGNYYHCLLDYATRLASAEYLVRDHFFLIGIPSAQAGLMVPILQALGFGESVLVLDEQPTVFQTVALAAATQREPHCHPAALRWLRERVRTQVRRGPARRVLISRRDASVRRLVNEAALADTLADFGVEPVVPSALSPAEQLALFASAEVIVAPHGAALANLVACEVGTKVIEIAADLGPSICFTQISKLFGFDHVLVRAQAVDVDLEVGIADVLAALTALGVEPQRSQHR